MEPKLYDAATSGNLLRLKQFVDENQNILLDQLTPQKNTALHIAVTSGHTHLVREIYNRCPSLIMKANSKADTPLHIAAREGRCDIVELLINYMRTFSRDVEKGPPQKVAEVLRVRNMQEDTALHEALRHNHLEVVRLLIREDHELSRLVNSDGESPLYIAADKGMNTAVELILRDCPLYAHCGPNGSTALHAAIFCQHVGITKLLLEKIPELIKQADNYGWAPFHYAVSLRSLEIVEKILEFDGSFAYVFDSNDAPALHIAASRGDIKMVETIIRWCPDSFELLDKKGRNALHIATIFGRVNIIRYFLKTHKLGGFVNEQDDEGNTPLHLACIYGPFRIARILTEYVTVDTMAKNKDNMTALDIVNSKEAMARSNRFAQWLTKMRLKSRGSKSSLQNWIKKENLKEKKRYDYLPKDKDEPYVKDLSATCLVVATIIASVTFTACFALPSGYNGNEGPNQALATLARSLAFKLFVISNTIAFCFSAIAMLIVLVSVIGISLGTIRMTSVIVIATGLSIWSVILMLVAFFSGLYAVLDHSPRLFVVAFISGSGLSFLVFFRPWL